LFIEARVRSFADLTTYQIITKPVALSFSTAYNGVGACSFQTTRAQAAALGLADQTLIELAPGGLLKRDTWFLLDGKSGSDVADDSVNVSWSGKSLLSAVGDALVYPSAFPTTIIKPGTIALAGHSFQLATPGFILQTLIARAQGRGALTWLDVSSFSGTTDSGGAAWTTSYTGTYANGQSYMQVLQDLMDRGLISVQMVGPQLRVYNYDGFVQHFTPDQVMFQRGKNMTEQTTNTDSAAWVSAVLVQGDNNIAIERTSAPSLAALGRRREMYIQAGGIIDGPTLNLIGDQQLLANGHVKQEDTVGATDTGLVPFVDYNVGDWAWEDSNGTAVNLQIVGIACAGNDEGNVKVGLTLGTKLAQEDAKIKRRLDSMLGDGSTSYGALPLTQPDFTPPAVVTGITLTIAAYRDSNGIDKGQVSCSWTPPTLNADGTVCTDLDHYEVSYTTDGGVTFAVSTLAFNTTTTTAKSFMSGFDVGASVQFRVRAVDSTGNASAYAFSGTVVIPKVITTPGTPSTPVVTTALRGLMVAWDGQILGGTAYDASWARTDVHISSTSGFTPSAATLTQSFITKGGAVQVAQLAYATTYYIKLIAWDKSGNQSAPSAQSSGVSAGQLSDPDLPLKLVQGAKIADSAVSTAQLTVAAMGDSVAPNGSFEDIGTATGDWAAKWRDVFNTGAGTSSRDTTAGVPAGGSAAAKLSITATPWQYWIGQSDLIPTTPGDLWYVKCKLKASRAFTGSVAVALAFTQAGVSNPTFFDAQNPITTVFVANVTTGWVEWEGQLLVPSGTTPNPIVGMKLVMQAGCVNDSAAIDIWVDDVQVAPIRGSAYIKDASIVNAKINNVSADKITVGTLAADISVAARIKTADTGARVELNSTGLQAFDATGAQTVAISAADGSASLTGNITSGSINAGSISASTLGSSTILASMLSGCSFVIDPSGGSLLVYALASQTVLLVTTPGTGNFTVPAGVTGLKVEAWGAGGGGSAGASVGSFGGSGGAGGEYAREDNYVVTPGAVLAYSVGSGGPGGTSGPAGGAGGNTTFDGSNIQAFGGNGAVGSYNVAGASGSKDSVHFSGGGNGLNQVRAVYVTGTGGGSSGGTSALGRAGGVAVSNVTPGPGGVAPAGGGNGGAGGIGTAVGVNGASPGGGGGGGGGTSGVAHAGGSGGNGQLRITYGGTRNLIASIAGVAGVDSFGNSYVAGIRTNVNTAAGLSGGYYEELIVPSTVVPNNTTVNWKASSTAKLISDYGSAYNFTTGQWTCPADGVYDISASITLAAFAAAGGGFIDFSSAAGSAGTIYQRSNQSVIAGQGWENSTTLTRFLTQGTTVFISVHQTSSASLTFSGVRNYTLLFTRRG
jgi:hypothetical protein